MQLPIILVQYPASMDNTQQLDVGMSSMGISSIDSRTSCVPTSTVSSNHSLYFFYSLAATTPIITFSGVRSALRSKQQTCSCCRDDPPSSFAGWQQQQETLLLAHLAHQHSGQHYAACTNSPAPEQATGALLLLRQAVLLPGCRNLAHNNPSSSNTNCTLTCCCGWG